MAESSDASVSSLTPPFLTVGQCATLACLLEVTAPKPGNVHRGADFEDLTLVDFVASAVAIGPVLERAAETGVGAAVLESVKATRSCVASNTNLGTVLLLAPLAAVPRATPLCAGIRPVLASLTPDDTRYVYAAIRLAHPGGLGTASRMDVMSGDAGDLIAAMREAAERDLVARQFTNGFEQVLGQVAPGLVAGRRQGWSVADSAVHVQVHLMADFPDSLIARKCGEEAAHRAAQLAARVLESGGPGSIDYQRALADLDFWLRSDGHRRNPGTSADLVAAGLFVVLREGLIAPPYN